MHSRIVEEEDGNTGISNMNRFEKISILLGSLASVLCVFSSFYIKNLEGEFNLGIIIVYCVVGVPLNSFALIAIKKWHPKKWIRQLVIIVNIPFLLFWIVGAILVTQLALRMAIGLE